MPALLRDDYSGQIIVRHGGPTANSQNSLNIVDYSLATGGTVGTLQEAAATVARKARQAWLTNFTAATRCVGWRFLDVKATLYVGGDVYTSTADVLPADQNGTLAAPPMPPNISVRVKKSGALGDGKRIRGALYLPAGYIRQNIVDASGVVQSNEVDAMVTRCNNWKIAFELAGADGLDAEMVIRKQVPVGSTTLYRVAQFSFTGADNVIAVQRRRLR
jgi:hypothetical protein